MRGKAFKWDGVSRDYASGELARGYQRLKLEGERTVISLHVVAYYSEGERVLDAFGGLEPLVWLKLDGDRYDYGERQDLFEDPQIVTEAVSIALRGLLRPPASKERVSTLDERTQWRRYESGPLSMMSNAPEAKARRIFEETLHFIGAAKTLLGHVSTPTGGLASSTI